jgi:hypothetical protein
MSMRVRLASLMQFRPRIRIETPEVLGDGDRLAGHFTATLLAHGSGDTHLSNQARAVRGDGRRDQEAEVFQHHTPGPIEFFDRNGPTS